MRVGLSDDPGRGAWSVPVALDDDLVPGGRCHPCSPEPDFATTDTVVVSLRGNTFRDADGDQRWTWTDHEARAVFTVTGRSEVDDASGQSTVTAEARIGWPADLPAFTATAVVTVEGVRWPVVEIKPLSGAVWVRMERITDDP
jgi:hypothetical protein